ncbi:MAG: Na/Pi cotransporter family protein [Spirochaetaceae bacterium]|jgi:phosphate:Na+ symporter|nr:Na/Pi cotransporter family protein [Spirochaetaceae bacterium]
MYIVEALLKIVGGLCLFLYGIKIMSDGIQQTAGERMQRTLNFMTGNRILAVLTGTLVTMLVQSSSAVSVMVVSFVNAGLLSLTQSIGVIMGANIGTTVTAWIVSLVGFEINISNLALPATGIGFFISVSKWKYRSLGEAFMGFGFIFLGLQFLTDALPQIGAESLGFIQNLSSLGFASIILALLLSVGITLLMHSSAATITLIITLAYGGVVNYEISATMILGANIGTTIDAIMAAIGAKTAAKRTALVHVLFNVIGSVIALAFLRPLLLLVGFLTPGPSVTLTGGDGGLSIATHLAMFHTVFNVLCTVLFLPFVKQFAALVTLLIKDQDGKPEERQPYKLEYRSAIYSTTPELNIVRAEKEIRDMAGLASSMYARFSEALGIFRDPANGEEAVAALVAGMREKEEIADEMREELTRFLMECTRRQLSYQSDRNVYYLMRIIADLEDMTDDCYSISLMLERSVKKGLLFKEKEIEALTPYITLVEEFLAFVREHLGRPISAEHSTYAEDLENRIDKYRDKLRKMGRKRIEAGEDVKTELLFIDLVRRIEKLGDICYNISEALSFMR